MRFLSIFLSVILFIMGFHAHAQVAPAPAAKDTVKEFEIIKGPSMRTIKTDTGTLQTIAGGAVIYQGGTKFYADSFALNNDTRNLQAFGKIHINDGDTVNIYSQYLTYNGNDKTAYLWKDVKLTGRNGTLTTNEMNYNLHAGIGNYYNGGRVINKKNVITSKEGTYYADTRDVYFKKDVKMDGPKNHIRTDSLIYNMNDAGLTFISEFYLKNNETEINSAQGTYDTKTGNAFFTSRTVVKDSSGRLYSANSMALDGKTGNAQLEGNGIIIDSANGFTLLGNQIFLNRDNNSFLATKKPVLIIKQKHDSTYIAADIIFSGLAKMVNDQLVYPTDTATKLSQQQSQKILDFKSDSAQNFLPAGIQDTLGNLNQPPSHQPGDSLKIVNADSLIHRTDSLQQLNNQAAQKNPSNNLSADTTLKNGSLTKLYPSQTAEKKENLKDTLGITVRDTLQSKNNSLQFSESGSSLPAKDTLQKPKDTTRYFLAYHNVRIYNDSLQSVCDSMFISSKDSVFRLYYSPVIWSENTQVTGDTMLLFTKNKEASRLFAFDKAMVVNRTREGFFNQMAGKTLNAYFRNNKFDYIRMKGSQSESIYYRQDDDSSYFGMNKATGDVIDMKFKDGELQEILMINQIKGTLYPMFEIPDDQRFLKGFEWLDQRRPKNRAELFQ